MGIYPLKYGVKTEKHMGRGLILLGKTNWKKIGTNQSFAVINHRNTFFAGYLRLAMEPAKTMGRNHPKGTEVVLQYIS